jgi:hypothetical protein
MKGKRNLLAASTRRYKVGRAAWASSNSSHFLLLRMRLSDERKRTIAIVKKLVSKPSMRALVVAAPGGYLKSLAPLPDRVEVSETLAGTHQFVQFLATKRSEIENREEGPPIS